MVSREVDKLHKSTLQMIKHGRKFHKCPHYMAQKLLLQLLSNNILDMDEKRNITVDSCECLLQLHLSALVE